MTDNNTTLRKSNQRYQAMIEQCSDGILTFDPKNGKLEEVNPQACNMLGYTAAELVQMTIYQFVDEEAHTILANIQKTAQAGKLFVGTRRYRRKDGSHIYVEVSQAQIDLPDGPLFMATIRDVTALKQTEEALRQSGEKLAMVLEGAKAGIWDYDVLTGQVTHDKRWKEILGYAEHEIGDDIQEWRSRWHPQDAAKIEQAMRDYFEGRTEKYEVEYRMRHKDGAYRWMLTNGKLSYDHKRQPVRWVGFNIDITERKRVETLLQLMYELQRRSDFLNDVINGVRIGDEQNRYFAGKLGIDFDSPLFGCMILSDIFTQHHQDQEDSGWRKVKESVFIALNDIPNVLAWDCREGIGVLCPAGLEVDNWEHSKEIGSVIRAKLLQAGLNIPVYVGISETHSGIDSLKGLYRQALHAAMAGQCQAAEELTVTHYRQAGIFQFIPEALRSEAAEEFIRHNIGKLIDYDEEKGGNLLQTLEELLSSQSIREIADRLYLHPKTVIFRRKRIEKLLGVDIDTFEVRLTLSIALKLYKLSCHNPGIGSQQLHQQAYFLE